MTLFITKMLLVINSFNPVNNSDSINFEQNAFDYFISKLDSIQIFNGGESFVFNKKESKIIFYGKTQLSISIPFELNHISRKINFLVMDSTFHRRRKNQEWLYPLKGVQAIQTKAPYIIIDTLNQYKINEKANDIKIFMTYRFFISGFYYVAISIDTGVDWVSTITYIKLTPQGKAIDWAIQRSIH